MSYSAQPATRESTQRISLDKLPPELLRHIASFIQNENYTHSLAPLSSTNKYIRKICQPLLYSRLYCNGFIGLVKLFYIGSSPHSTSIRDVTFDWPDIRDLVEVSSRQAFVREVGRLCHGIQNLGIQQYFPTEWNAFMTATFPLLAASQSFDYVEWETERMHSHSKYEVPYKNSVGGDDWADTNVDLEVLLKNAYLLAIKLAAAILITRNSKITSIRLFSRPLASDLHHEVILGAFLQHKHLTDLTLQHVTLSTISALDLHQITKLEISFPNWFDISIRQRLSTLLAAIQPHLKSLFLTLPTLDDSSDTEFENRVLYILPETCIEWPALESLRLRIDNDFIMDGYVEDDEVKWALAQSLRCPSLLTLDVNSDILFTSVVHCPNLRKFRCFTGVGGAKQAIEWLEGQIQMQEIYFNMTQRPGLGDLSRLFDGLPQVRRLHLIIDFDPEQFSPINLTEAFLLSGRDSLHSSLLHFSMVDGQKNQEIRWTRDWNVLRRLFPTLETFGDRKVEP